MSRVEKFLRGVVGIGAIVGLFVGLAFLAGALSCDSLRRLARSAGKGAPSSASATGSWGDGPSAPLAPPVPPAQTPGSSSQGAPQPTPSMPVVPSTPSTPSTPSAPPAPARAQQDAVVYIYSDDDGTPNIVQGIQNVPDKYKDRAKPHQ